MIQTIEQGGFDTCLSFSDWRYAAAATGIMRMCESRGLPYQEGLGKDMACICYRREDVVGEWAEEPYLLFVESWFGEFMHHVELEALLKLDEWSEEQFERAKAKTKANSIAKKVFQDLPPLAKENSGQYLATLQKNRLMLIKESYRNGKSLYAKFCNPALLLSPAGKICRLLGYYVDTARKTKSIAYRWDASSYVYADEPEFDYIPLGFSRPQIPRIPSSFFINNNFSAHQLLQSNNSLDQSILGGNGARASMFAQTREALHYIDYDVEVLSKAMDDEFFNNLYVRKMATIIFSLIAESYQALTYPCQLNNEWLNIEELVTDSIINDVRLDPLIDALLRERADRSHSRLISTLITVNSYIYNGGELMSENQSQEAATDAMQAKKLLTDPLIEEARKAGYWAKKSIQSSHRPNTANQESRGVYIDPKIKSYYQKLTACLIAHDYERFCEILLQLSAYSGVVFGFANYLFEDFKKHKNMAYAFVNALAQNEYNPNTKQEVTES